MTPNYASLSTLTLAAGSAVIDAGEAASLVNIDYLAPSGPLAARSTSELTSTAAGSSP